MGKSQTTAKNKYNAKSYDRISVIVKKGVKDEWKAEAEKLGLSLNAFVERAVNQMIKQENVIKMVLEIPLDKLDLSIKTYKCLYKAKIDTIGSFKHFIETNEINKIVNFNKMTAFYFFNKLKECENKYNVSLHIDYNNLLSQLPDE